MIGNINSLRRQVKNVAYNYSDAQVKVREATSNDPWGPSSSLMSEIADMTYNTMAFTEIMQIIWKRLNDHGKNWRHVYKSLVLLDYLIKVGSEKVAQQCRENIFAIQTLKDFQYIEENKDQGMNVREKAKQLVNLLKDDERLKNERARALMAKKRFAQNGIGIGSDGSTHEFRRSDTYPGSYDDPISPNAASVNGSRRRGSELEDCRPSSVGEEELQLQIALALSKEEAQREDDVRKGDDMRLQMAIVESRHDDDDDASSPMAATAASGSGAGRAEKSAIDDLLSLQPSFAGGNAASASATAFNDPWGGNNTASTKIDPWGAPMSTEQSQQPPTYAASVGAMGNDPWAPAAADASFHTPASGAIESPAYSWPSAGDSAMVTATHDPFSPPALGPPVTGSGIGPRSASADPWGMDGVKTALPPHHTGGSDSGVKARNVKTPEHFLGENSALVNLDNLMGPPRTGVASVPPKSNVNNPFAGSSLAASGQLAPTNNPFAAQQRPSPTLNEMRSSGGFSNTSNTAAWNLQQPLQPASSTNPFL